MAQTTQIVPKFSFPYIETVVNDYTEVVDVPIEDAVDSSFKQVYVITAAKGIDNTWVKKSSYDSAVKTFGESNFAKYGQPYMQALNVLKNNTDIEVYLIRVIPENAKYANAIISILYKADDTSVQASDRKFRIKLEATSYEDVNNEAAYKALLNDGFNTFDAEGFKKVPFMAHRYSGRGTCGNKFSVRCSQASAYEKEYGIKLYDFEIMNYENGLVKDYDYVGSLVSSAKYNESTTTQINDLLADAETGLPPVDVFVLEDRIQIVYDAYVEFVKQLNADLEVEYEEKLVEYAIPEDQMNGTVPMEDQYIEYYNDLLRVENLIEETADDNIPDLDEFDIIFGREVGNVTLLPGIKVVTELTDDIDTTAEDYNPDDYTTDTNIVNYSSTKGLELIYGTNGEFDTPSEGKTYDDEVSACMVNAFNGTYDRKILSSKRMPLTVVFDANYPFEVKQALADLILTRNDCPVRFDAGIITSFNEINTLVTRYKSFNDRLESIDIQNYDMKEPSTNKRCTVTINYLLASRYVSHCQVNGYHIPFVKDSTRLAGHIKDSLRPVIEDYNTGIKEILYDNRFNYYECVRENVFWRAVQNTRQSKNSDLLEESNMMILCTLKKEVEYDLAGQLYNFADESVRTAFVNYENSKYANWNARIVQTIEFSFATSEYEFEHSILHLYVAVVFRGLTKRVIVEIDINKRQYSTETTDTVE